MPRRGRGRARGGRGRGRGRGGNRPSAPSATHASTTTSTSRTATASTANRGARDGKAPPPTHGDARRHARLLARIERYRNGEISDIEWDSDDAEDTTDVPRGGDGAAVPPSVTNPPTQPMRRPDGRAPDMGALFSMGGDAQTLFNEAGPPTTRTGGGKARTSPATATSVGASASSNDRDARRARLRAQIAAKRNARSGVARDEVVRDARGRRVPGVRRADMPSNMDEATAMLAPLGISRQQLMQRVQQKMAAAGGGPSDS